VRPALLALTALSACAAPLPSRPVNRPAVEPLEEFVGAIHVHTGLSHDSPGSTEEVVRGAAAAGLDFVIFTEHARREVRPGPIAGARDGVLFVPGLELSKDGGSLLALGVHEPLDPKAGSTPELARQIRAGGGLAAVGHLAQGGPARTLPDPDAIGLYNLHDDARDRSAWLVLPALLWSHVFPDRRLRLLPLLDAPRENLREWDRRLARGSAPVFAECDAHAKLRFGPFFLDPYEDVFRFVRNHVLLPRLTERTLLDGLRAGRLFIAFDFLGDAAGFRFAAALPGGGAVPMGGAAPLVRGTRLAVRSPHPARLRVLRDGKRWAQVLGRSLDAEVGEPGVYRVEAAVRVAGGWRPWVYTNAIRLEPREGPP